MTYLYSKYLFNGQINNIIKSAMVVKFDNFLLNNLALDKEITLVFDIKIGPC